MNKMNKKGFTIVELVIVIAVIAILAGVLIPTFGGIIERANLSAELQEVTAAYKNAYAVAISNDGKATSADLTDTSELGNKTDKCLKVDGYDYEFYCTDAGVWTVKKLKDGANSTKVEDTEYTYKCENGVWTVTETANNG